MAGETKGPAVYRFGEFAFDSRTGELCRDAETETLRPQVAAALALLLERSGELVGRDELRHELWQDGRIVSFDMAISTVVRQLRRALGDDPREPRYIETIPKRGYRFRCAVEVMPRPSFEPRRVSPLRRRVTHAAGLLFISLASLLLGGTASPPDSRSSVVDAPLVAVLPFNNLTGNGANDVHAHALTDAVISYLSRVAPDRLRVTGMASVLPFAGRATDPVELGTELEADYLLEGGYRALDEVAVASVRLVSVSSGEVVWSRDYRRVAATPELAARSIAALTVGELAGLTVASGPPGAEVQSRVPEAVARFREAKYMLDRSPGSQGQEAVGALRQAVALDPGYAAAHALLAQALIDDFRTHASPERIGEARTHAGRALDLDPHSASAHRVLGNIELYFERDWEGAGQHLARAVDLAPGSAQSHHAMALWYSARGLHAEAAASIELARVLDPRSVAVNTDVMFVHLYARDYEAALEAARRLGRLTPESDWHLRWEVIARAGAGDIAGAADTARRANAALARQRGEEPESLPADDLGAVTGYFARLAQALEYWSRDHLVDPVALAQWFALSGQTDRATRLIEGGLDARYFSYFVPFLGVSPAYDPLRGTADFEAELRGLAQSGLAPADDGLPVAAAYP